MTAEIAILNRMGVALAADSAVTIGTKGGPKIYNTVNKLFSLSKFEPVGIMVYGIADFMTIPWEVIVKQYRVDLGRERLPSLKDYADSFLTFLSDKENVLFPQSMQTAYLEAHLGALFSDIKKEIEGEVETCLKDGEEVTESEVAQIVRTKIEEKRTSLLRASDLPEASASRARRILQRRPELLKDLREMAFEQLPMSGEVLQRLKQVAVLAIYKRVDYWPYSGVVIAGFGSDEHYPSLYAYEVEGVVDGLLRYGESRKAAIGPDANSATILPFAQGEMVHTFMRGLDPTYDQILEGFVEHLATRMGEVFVSMPGCNLGGTSKRPY
ncbi:MAG: hypothetical protein H0U53_05510 [Actinobacteria bacterium]|nr:hypothetical protein [Actinomycetota bacterium]